MARLTPLWDSDTPAIHAAIDMLFAPVFETTSASLETIRLYDQRSSDWLFSRRMRLTASNFGAAAGLSPYCSPKKLLLQMLFGSFKGNAATEYGSKNEKQACDAYVDAVNSQGKIIEYRDSGLGISPAFPFLGASPDGIITAQCSSIFRKFPPRLNPVSFDSFHPKIALPLRFELVSCNFNPDVGLVTTARWQQPAEFPHEFLLEIKCPFRKRLYGTIPAYYYAQIQGCMEILDLPYTHFYVWTPTCSSLDCYPRNVDFWTEFLRPRLVSFYFEQYMPLAFLESRGELVNRPREGEPSEEWLEPSQFFSAEYVETVRNYCRTLMAPFLNK